MFQIQDPREDVTTGNELDRRRVRYFFSPRLLATENNYEYEPGKIHYIQLKYRQLRADEAAEVGITYLTPGVKQVPGRGFAGELLAVPILPGDTLSALVNDAATREAGGREITALAGALNAAEKVNAWIFSKGSKTLAQLKASLQAATKELFIELGFPPEKETAELLANVRREVADAIAQAESDARNRYDSYLHQYHVADSQKQPINFMSSRAYRELLAWLDEVSVADKAMSQMTASQIESQKAAMQPFIDKQNKTDQLLEKLVEIQVAQAAAANNAVTTAAPRRTGKPATEAEPA